MFLASLDLTCFGPPTARVGGREPPADVLWPKHLGLLVYLALSPRHSRTRDHLLGVFWAESTEAKARGALNETIRRLRRSLGADRITSHAETLALCAEGLDVDALRFDAVAQHNPEAAAAMVNGDFLEGFAVAGGPAFEEWASLERDRYRDKGVAVLIATGERHLTASRYSAAQDVARRALAIRPHAEPAARLLIRATALSGDAPGAARAFEDFRAQVREGLGREPSRGLAAVVERVRSQVRNPATGAPADAVSEPPLVGRTAERETAFAVVQEGLVRGPRTLFLSGAPGMGRTRLLTECGARAALDGAVVAVAHPLPSDHDAPWSTLRVLMRAGLRQAPGLVAAPSDALGVLGGIVPDLAEGVAPRAPADVEDVAAALAAVIRTVADEMPVVIAIDDAHLADSATLGALFGAVAQLDGAPCVFMLSAEEPAEPVPAELLLFRSEIGRRLRGATVTLKPLGDADIRALVDQLASWCDEDEKRDRLARRVVFETDGNPFFAVTLLRALARHTKLRDHVLTFPQPQATFETPLPISVPDLVRLAVEVRIKQLDAEPLQVLSAASVTGAALDLDLITVLTGLPVARVEDALPPLERLHFVRYDGERYAFTAPLVVDVVRASCLTPGHLRTLRKRAAAALAGRTDLESRVLRVELWAKVEPGEEAFAEASAVARAALESGTARTARRALLAAEEARGPQT